MTNPDVVYSKTRYILTNPTNGQTVMFGDGTNMPVSKAEIQPWNVNNQDFQIIRTDEVRFGLDNLVPAPIVFTMAVLNNWQLESIPGDNAVPDGFLYQARTLLGQLANAWKATAARQTWGAMVKLLFIDTDGVSRRIYGRPGKFQHGPVEQKEWVDVQAEFRRADTNAYDDTETVVEIGYNNNPVYIFRDRGDAPAWFRLLLYGPITHPTVTIGNVQVELGMTIDPSTIVEVSSYPWMRRIVDTNNINWRAALIGSSQYLDQLQIPAGVEIACRWTDQNYATWTVLDSAINTQNPDFLSMFAVTSTWHTIYGTPIWGLSLKTGGYLYGPFGITAIVDLVNQYTTPNQYIEASIADIWKGESTLVYKSAPDMSNFAGLQVYKSEGLGQDLGIATAADTLSIVTGTAYNAQTIQYTWNVPSPGIHSGDRVGLQCQNNVYQIYYQGNPVGNPWTDAGNIVNAANVNYGFVCNLLDDCLTPQLGVGFNNVVGYDWSLSTTYPPSNPNDMASRVFLYWRDTWSIE